MVVSAGRCILEPAATTDRLERFFGGDSSCCATAQVGAAAAVYSSRQAALRALRELHKAQLQVEVDTEAQVCALLLHTNNPSAREYILLACPVRCALRELHTAQLQVEVHDDAHLGLPCCLKFSTGNLVQCKKQLFVLYWWRRTATAARAA